MRYIGKVFGFVAAIGAILFVYATLFGGSGPEGAAYAFMSALGKGDVDQLVKLSYLGNKSEDRIRKEWEFACKVAAPNYVFHWDLQDVTRASDTEASAKIQTNPGDYDHNYNLPMIKTDKGWKVHVEGINPEMYPGIPR